MRPKTVVAALALATLLLPLSAPSAWAGDPGHVVAKLDAGVDPHAIAAETDTTVVGPLIASRNIWRFHSSTDAHHAADEIEHEDGVVYAEEDDAELAPRAGGRMSGWADDEAEQVAATEADFRQQPATTTVRLDDVDPRATGSQVRVAVLDTGLDAAALPWVTTAGGWDLVDDDADTSEVANGVDDDGDGRIDESHGHGTHVAGVISLVAPDAVITSYRILDADGNGSTFAAAEAIWMALEQGVDVINMSFGAEEKSDVLEDAVKDAHDADVILVAAAGNSGEDEKQYPAAHGDVHAIGAADTQGLSLASLSSRGGWIDLVAPGEDVLAPIADGRYARWSGTSMATPFVAGQVALLRDLVPGIRPDKVWKALKKDTQSVHDGGEGLIDIARSVEWVIDEYDLDDDDDD